MGDGHDISIPLAFISPVFWVRYPSWRLVLEDNWSGIESIPKYYIEVGDCYFEVCNGPVDRIRT